MYIFVGHCWELHNFQHLFIILCHFACMLICAHSHVSEWPLCTARDTWIHARWRKPCNPWVARAQLSLQILHPYHAPHSSYKHQQWRLLLKLATVIWGTLFGCFQQFSASIQPCVKCACCHPHTGPWDYHNHNSKCD